MIVYHGTPVGIDQVWEEKVFFNRHLIVSFATEPSIVPRLAAFAGSIVLDNGAFTEWRQGRAVDVPAFYDWAGRSAELPAVAWFCIPDTIDGDEAANDALLLTVPPSLRSRAVPVWHMHESVARLRALCDAWPMIAIGSSGEVKTPGTSQWWARMREAWPAIPKTTRVHGLRMAAEQIASRIPFASVDSTTAARNAGNDDFWESTRFRRCKKWVRVEAYCQELEGVQPTLTFNPPEANKQGFIFGEVA
jgi:hypothetical protein